MNIAILGCGTVATGVVKTLASRRADIEKRAGQPINISRILARTPQKALNLGFSPEQICSSIEPILADSSIDTVVELIGGTGDAFDFIVRALKAGKHVVTANKDLIAEQLQTLLDIAAQNKVKIAFEASVGGGIPLITPLHRMLSFSGLDSIYGILNGTTNYILTRMSQDNLSYEASLQQARELGYAEADPTSDVEGLDAARKIAILASLAFHSPVKYADVHHEGISSIAQVDMRIARRYGYAIKLLAAAKLRGDALSVYVRPALVPVSHPLASVNDVYNAVFISGLTIGDIMLYGQGAGAMPTANSVISDITDICREQSVSIGNSSESLFYNNCHIAERGAEESVYYVRLLVEDKPKVLASVATVFGEYGISLASLLQEQREGGLAELMIFTHTASEGAVSGALQALAEYDHVKSCKHIICLER